MRYMQPYATLEAARPQRFMSLTSANTVTRSVALLGGVAQCTLLAYGTVAPADDHRSSWRSS